MTEDFVAAAKWVKARPEANGKLGAIGFCFGGGIVNQLAVRLGADLGAGAPFHGRQPSAEDTAKIKAPLMLHYAANDQGIDAGIPAFEAPSRPTSASSRRMCTKARSTAFTTTRRRGTTKPPRSSRGSGR